MSHASETILIIDAYETFLMLKTFVLLNIFVETVIKKNSGLIWKIANLTEHIGKIKNAFAVTFDQINASLLKKVLIIIFFIMVV